MRVDAQHAVILKLNRPVLQYTRSILRYKNVPLTQHRIEVAALVRVTHAAMRRFRDPSVAQFAAPVEDPRGPRARNRKYLLHGGGALPLDRETKYRLARAPFKVG